MLNVTLFLLTGGSLEIIPPDQKSICLLKVTSSSLEVTSSLLEMSSCLILQEDHLSLRVIWNAKYMSKHSQQKRIHLFTDKVSYNSTPSQQTILFFHIILLDLKRDFLDTLLEHHCYKNKMLRNIEKCPTLPSG